MKIEMKYWVDMFGGKVDKIDVKLEPYRFRMDPITHLKVLIAERDTRVEKGKPAIVKVQTVLLPANTFVGPLNIIPHALGSVIDIVECGIPTMVEEEKCINNVVFLPIESGEIKKGDLIGILKVFFVKTGFFGKTFGVGRSKTELIPEKKSLNIVWREDGNIYRESREIEEISYKRTHIALWEPLIADEEMNLEAGKLERIRIREITLPPNTVVVPTALMMNAYGCLIDVVELGKPLKVEEERKITQAIFLPIEDGKVEKGDLLGVLAVYFIGLEDYRLIVKGEAKEFTMVYRSGRGVIRKAMKMDPFGFKRMPVGGWELLIADETKKVEYGKTAVIAVKKLRLPKNTLIYPMGVMRHIYGTFVGCILTKMAKVEEEKEISKVVFLPLMDGEVQKGDLLGIVNIYEVEVSRLEKLKGWINEWIQWQYESLYE